MVRTLIFLLTILLIHGSGPSFGQGTIDPRLLQKLQAAAPDDALECIIYLAQAQPETANLKRREAKAFAVYNQLRSHARTTQQPVLNWIQSHHKSWQSHWIVNSLKVYLTGAEMREVIQLPNVEKIVPNPQWKLTPPPAEWKASTLDTRGAVPWGITRIGADSLWALGIRGQGVTIGGEDTGYEWEHPALKQQYRGYRNDGNADHNYNWHDAIHDINPLNQDSMPTPASNPCGLDSPVPCDDHSHGTHTMGTMAGSAPEESIGVAPEANWIGCRCMERGWGSPWTYLECFEWLLAPTDLNGENANPDLGPAVINNSWGCPPAEGCNTENFSLLDEAIRQLKAAGIFVVVSAGNDGNQGCSSIYDPAAIYASSFTIGAIRQDDTIASFSSRGPVLVDGSGRLKPDLVAPGVNVRSAVLGGGYQNWNGTSMSGPHVAGAVALLISALPELDGDVERIQYLLEASADPMLDPKVCGPFDGMMIPNAYYGYGILNVWKAYQLALETSNNQLDSNGDWDLRIYPNPSTDLINLNWSQKIAVREIRIYDQVGRLLTQENIHTYGTWTRSIAAFGTGMYYLQLISNNGTRSVKFMKS